MTSYFYKTNAPEAVAIVRDFYDRKDSQLYAIDRLGKLFGGAVAPMRDVTSHFAGGVKLSSSRELDVHWRRPDDVGYRSLRAKPTLPKGISKEERATIRDEHTRLVALWNEHCPPRLSTHKYWEQLGVNTGNLMLCGGIKFEIDGVAYFNLGFDINESEHLANVAAGKPTAGWIEGAVEITATEYETARHLKLKSKAVAQ
jgi:hypothetical protein